MNESTLIISQFCASQDDYREVNLPTLDNLVVLAAVLQVRMDDILVITDPAAQIQISA